MPVNRGLAENQSVAAVKETNFSCDVDVSPQELHNIGPHCPSSQEAMPKVSNVV